MKKRHIRALRYRVVPDESVDYKKAAPVIEETADFTMEIDGDTVSFEMKRQYEKIEEARQVVDSYLRAWEVLIGLEQDPDDLKFDFKNADIVDSSSEVDSHLKSVAAVIHAQSKVHGTLHVSRGKYPAPPRRFKFSPDVETMYTRYKAYRQGRESLLSMAYMCLTVLEASAGGRNKRPQAAKSYSVAKPVLDKLGEFCSQKGGQTEARKAPVGRTFVTLTPKGKKWVVCVIKALIRRAGEWAYDTDAQLQQITMNDFPNL